MLKRTAALAALVLLIFAIPATARGRHKTHHRSQHVHRHHPKSHAHRAVAEPKELCFASNEDPEEVECWLATPAEAAEMESGYATLLEEREIEVIEMREREEGQH